MKNTFNFCIAFMLLFSFSVSAQLTELTLDPEKVSAGVPHYNDGAGNANPDGNQIYPGAQVDDPFTYDPNDPTSDTPFRSWKSNPDFSYFFMMEEDFDVREVTEADFPNPAKDTCYMMAEFEIPTGKQIRYLDCWAQSETAQDAAGKHLVIILKDDNGNMWYKWDWIGASNYTDGVLNEDGHARFDFLAAGVTDNLNKSATKIIICNTTQSRVRLAEFRIALEDNPSANDHDAPVLSEIKTTVPEYINVQGKCNEIATIFLLPEGTYADLAAINAAYVKKQGCLADSLFYFASEDLDYGKYVIAAVDGNNNITVSTDVVDVIADATKPVVSGLEAMTIVESTWFAFDCDEISRAHLVPVGTTADSASVALASVASVYVSEPGTFYLQTQGASAKDYVIMTIDRVNNVSLPSVTITIDPRPEFENLAKAITSNPVLVGANYSDKFNEGVYAFTDKFAYAPANPTADKPYAGWSNDKADQYCFASGGNKSLAFDVTISSGKTLYALDLWGRVWAGEENEDYVSDDEAKRSKNLMVYLRNADSTVTWETPANWIGTNSPADGSYGRLVFATAGVPAELLANGGHVTIRQETNDYMHICEVRVVEADPFNYRPIAVAGNDTTVNAGDVITLNGSGSYDANGDALTYKWAAPEGIDLDDNEIAMPTFTAPSTPGEYEFSLKVTEDIENGQRSTAAVVYITVVDASAIDSETASSLVVYPNPTDNGFTVDMTMMLGTSNITVYDISGKTVISTVSQSSDQFYIGTEDLESGAYFLNITNDNKSFIQKLIVR